MDDDDELDALSDITDSSDLEHAAVNTNADWQTYEDKQDALVKVVAARMRQYPLMPM